MKNLLLIVMSAVISIGCNGNIPIKSNLPTIAEEMAWEQSRLKEEERQRKIQWDKGASQRVEVKRQREVYAARLNSLHKNLLLSNFNGLYNFEKGSNHAQTQYDLIRDIIGGKTNIKNAQKTIVRGGKSSFKVMSEHGEYVLFRDSKNDIILKLYLMGEDKITPVENQEFNIYALSYGWFAFAGIDKYITVTGSAQQVFTFFVLNPNTHDAINNYIAKQ